MKTQSVWYFIVIGIALFGLGACSNDTADFLQDSTTLADFEETQNVDESAGETLEADPEASIESGPTWETDTSLPDSETTHADTDAQDTDAQDTVAQDTDAQDTVDEDARRSALPDLEPQTRTPFDGCFKEAEDNPLSDEDLSNPVLDEIRSKIAENELKTSKQSYPIVLVPGYMGTDSMDFVFTEMDYWHGIVEALAEQGYTQVYPADIDAIGYSSDGPIGDSPWIYDGIDPVEPGYRGRSAQLKDIVEEVLEETKASKVNLIAHSQGGLTARWMISNLGMADKVENLITLSGAHKGVPLTELTMGDTSLPAWLVEPVEQIMTTFLGGITDSSDDANSHGSHVEMWPEYTNNVFNPNCPDMPGVSYFSFAAELSDIGDSALSPYLLSPFWAIHVLYGMDLFDVGPNDGLIPVESTKGPFDDGNWTYVGSLVGKKVIPGTGTESKYLGIYWGVDHAAFMNFPFGKTELFHFNARHFFIDLARMLDAYSK